MAKRKAKRTVKQPTKHVEDEPVINYQSQSTTDDREVERRIAAIRAIGEAEIGQLLTGLRLLRSNFNSEQLQTPVMQFFKENMPNLKLKMNEKDGQFAVEREDRDDNVSISHADEQAVHASILQRMSKEYPDFVAGIPAIGGYEFSSKAVNTDLLAAANLQIPDFVVEEPSETHLVGLPEAFRTPGANTQRLSIGTTPKTLRLPKHGEMLLSVRGSPLGVYKEDNMEAINELEEG